MQCVFDKNCECKVFSKKHKLIDESNAYFLHLWCIACRLNEMLNILKTSDILEDIFEKKGLQKLSEEVLRKDWDSREDEIWDEY